MGPACAHSCDLWPNDGFVHFAAAPRRGGVGWEDGDPQYLTVTRRLKLELRHIGKING